MCYSVFMGTLSKYQITIGRQLYSFFSAFNSVSFSLVTGNVLVLYALYLQASGFIIGLITAFNFLSFFAIPLGRFFSERKPIMRVYAHAWILRNTCLLIMVPIPILVRSDIPELGLVCILLSSFGFNFFRGVGLVANNPVISDLAPGRDRGSFLVRLSLVSNAAALFTTLGLAFALKYGDSLTILSIAIIVGIIFGYISSFILYKMPSSDAETKGQSKNFSKNFLTAVHDRNFRLFIVAFSIIGIGVGMARPFIIVYCREVYAQPDSLVTFITFFSSLGALCMGLVSRLFIDKIGAKPMYLLFTALAVLSLIPTVISPNFIGSSVIFIYLCVIAFVSNLGFSGEENAGQTYFFGLIPRESVMDLSIIYFLVSGASGAIGSLLGGIILDAFKETGFSSVASYRLFFSIQIVIISISFYVQLRLKPMDSYTLKEALPLFFSARDIRGLSLLYKLDRSKSVNEKTVLLGELRLSNTFAAASNLLEHLASPSFSVRSEALAGMESLPKLNTKIIDILISELDRGLYTTAYRAARILGMFKVAQAIPELIKRIVSEDYILAGESMVALARIGDERAQGKISEVLETTENTHVLLWGIRAMEIYANPSTIPILENVLRVDYGNKAVEHEVMLAFASIMGIEKAFFPAYSQYSENKDLSPNILTDLFEEIASRKKMKEVLIPPLILKFLENSDESDAFFQNMRTYSKKQGGLLSGMLISSIIDTDLIHFHSFRFFLCFWVIMLLAEPKLMQK